MAASVKQGIRKVARNKNARYKLVYTYKQSNVNNSNKLKYTYSKQISKTTSLNYRN